MKISNISFLNNDKNYKTQIQKTNKTINSTPQISLSFAKMPTTAQYLAFLGYSGDLRETYKHLTFDECPFQIYNNILAELSKNNPDDKTLYDVHFEKYKHILDCYSLDELKQNFPEFKDVFSAYDVEALPDSVVGDFQNGESEIFTTEEDLALQLVKLYWGQGFSLNDLSDFVAQHSSDNQGKNLQYAMKKLRIPRMNSKYAHVLKFSNKDYFKNYSEQMKIKLAEAREAKEQRAQGEPVVIPRGQLSEAHKKHISDGLRRYYQQNPIAIYNLSERQKRFYEENPKAKKELSIVMDYAWNKTQEGRSVKKNLSKFMKKIDNFSEEQLISLNLTSKQKDALKAFWDKNPWAKDKYSLAVKQGWKYLENAPEIYFNGESAGKKVTIDTMPKMAQEKIRAWAKKQGFALRDDIVLGRSVVLYSEEKTIANKEIEKIMRTSEIISKKYAEEFPKEIDKITSSKQLALIKFKKELEENSPNLPKIFRNKPELIQVFNNFLEFEFQRTPIYREIENFGKTPRPDNTDTEISGIITDLQEFIIQKGEGYEVADYFSKSINYAYELFETNDTENILKIIK